VTLGRRRLAAGATLLRTRPQGRDAPAGGTVARVTARGAQSGSRNLGRPSRGAAGPQASHRTARLAATVRGRRLDQALVDAFPELSRARLQSLIRTGHVLLEGAPAKSSARVKGGERVELTLPPPTPTRAEAEELPLTILFQDRDLLVLDKAPGVVVHPAVGHWRGTLVNALLHHVRDLAGVGGALRPGLVHRLDKDTSGCLVVAKTDAALVALQEAFKTRQVEKTYLALVHGHPPLEGRIETPYGRHPRHRQRYTGRLRTGKPAVTVYRTRERLQGATLLEVHLLTGRTHQIRVHLAEAGYPLLGDALYGGTRRGSPALRAVQSALGRQALHAWRLAFPHPRTGKRRAFEAPVPADLQATTEALRVP
jgi:23S rRNA pseudouridine1911/1915/1917 synthase